MVGSELVCLKLLRGPSTAGKRAILWEAHRIELVTILLIERLTEGRVLPQRLHQLHFLL